MNRSLSLFLVLFLFITSAHAFKGAEERVHTYKPLLEGKRVAIVANQTSRVGKMHLVDFLLEEQDIDVVKIFALEHGFRGNQDAGATIKDGIDQKTGLPVVSLYGGKKAPSEKDLADVDVILFDIQDVGVRFFTYISSLGHLMEAASRFDKRLVVLDKPNPNIDQVDGPVLKQKWRSFVGFFPLPIVYGLTIGELALMAKFEKWVKGSSRLDLRVIKMKGYSRGKIKFPTVKPSPNLPSPNSMRQYASLAFFEATTISIGRGTKNPFEMIGHPQFENQSFSFTPKSIIGMSRNPKHKGKVCHGVSLKSLSVSKSGFTWKWLLRYFSGKNVKRYLTSAKFFNKLMGDEKILKMLRRNKSISEIRKSYAKELSRFKKKKVRYHLYD